MFSFRFNFSRGIAIVLLTIVMPLSFLLSCNRDKQERVEVFFDPQTSFTMKKINVVSTILDSGIIRYKLITPTWLIFGKASEPYQFFPDGIYGEQFDSLLNSVGSIKADTAYYYERRKLWEAKGNVDITNVEGIRVQTSQIFWDQQKKSIYSDAFTRVTKGDRVQTGTSFRSNEDLSEYDVFNATAEIPVETQRHTSISDSIPADTVIPAKAGIP